MASKKRTYFAIGCLLACLAFVLGVLIGYFSHLARDLASKDEKYQTYKSLTRSEDTSITEKLLNSVDINHIDEALRFFTAEPALAGTKRQKETADYVFNQFKKFGLEAEMSSYDVLLSYPVETHTNTIELLAGDGSVLHTTTPMGETLDGVAVDQSKYQAFNAFSPSGTVQGELVYANYGTRSDFEVLKQKGIDCTGKIVIARYGRIFRGNKVEFAHKAGAIGVILYSDPKDTTPANKNESGVYPDTWWLPDTGIQRGNVVMYKGDQSTPGYPAAWYSYRLPDIEIVKKLPKIPSQPISAVDAYKLLSELEGEEVDESWQGGFNITIRYGPKLKSRRQVKMDIKNELKYMKVHNVCGKLKGRIEPDRYIIVGNHRDSWVYGGADPHSGSSILQETARMFGKVYKEGWQPRRSLLFCSWDGEEYGLVGSYEWVEDNFKWLAANAVAYVNMDSGVTGNETIHLKSVPLLEDVFIKATTKVPDPRNSKLTMNDTWGAQHGRKRISKIGAGSDFVPFVANVGVPSYYAVYCYSGSEWNSMSTPLYHSRYETYRLARMIDPETKFKKAMTQIQAEVIRDLSDSVIIPFKLDDYIQELKTAVNKLVNDGLIFADTTIMKKELDGLLFGLSNVTAAADKFNDEMENVDTSNLLAVRSVNDKLMWFEKAFIDINGLPERPRYKHLLHSPNGANYYDGIDFPGLEDLMFSYNKDHASETWEKIKKHLASITNSLYAAAKLLS